VIIDLWPLYESGEASQDTRLLIEEFLLRDVELARLVRESPDKAMRVDVLPPLNREREVETIRKTKRLVRLRDALFGLAIFLSFTPLTVYDTAWGSGWVIRDHPLVACVLVLVAVVTWSFYFLLRRRLSASGL
jgi:hypothetical protein